MLPKGEYDLHKIGTLSPDTYAELMDLIPYEPETEKSSADCREELALSSPAVPRQDRKGCVEGGGEARGTEGDGRSGQISLVAFPAPHLPSALRANCPLCSLQPLMVLRTPQRC